jgi:hypothetical protein
MATINLGEQMNISIDELAELAIKDVKADIEKLAQLKGWNIKSVKGLISCLPAIIKHVEELGKVKDLAGEQKQELACLIILKLIKLPCWLPTAIVKPVLYGAINAVVEAIKNKN